MKISRYIKKHQEVQKNPSADLRYKFTNSVICLASFVTVVLSTGTVKFIEGKMKELGKSERHQNSRGTKSLCIFRLNSRMCKTRDQERARL